MSTQYAFGKIVTDGLILSLDAADRNSYSGSGTVWNDLSGFNSSGSLRNGPTFSSTNGGSIVLDGTDDFITGSQNITFPTGSQALTIEAWINVQDTGIGAIFGYGPTGVNGARVELGIRASNYVVVAIAGSAYGFSDASNLNNWIHLVAIPGTLNSQTIMYKNAIQQSIVLQSGADLTRNITLISSYAVGIISGGDVSSCLLGSVATVKLYNRVLSADEITQNYNAQKSRFGL
jgi:hypothetical protein